MEHDASDTYREIFHIAGFLSIMNAIFAGNAITLHQWTSAKDWYADARSVKIDATILSSKMLQDIADF